MLGKRVAAVNRLLPNCLLSQSETFVNNPSAEVLNCRGVWQVSPPIKPTSPPLAVNCMVNAPLGLLATNSYLGATGVEFINLNISGALTSTPS